MVLSIIFDFFLGLVNSFAQSLTWLTTTLPVINLSPLDLLTFNGIVVVIGFLVVRLVIGG